jgi:hypothetical protein
VKSLPDSPPTSASMRHFFRIFGRANETGALFRRGSKIINSPLHFEIAKGLQRFVRPYPL